jgi:hypothetical protein
MDGAKKGEATADQDKATADQILPNLPDPARPALASATPAPAAGAPEANAKTASAEPLQATQQAGRDGLSAQRLGPGAARRGPGLPAPELANMPAPARGDSQSELAGDGGARPTLPNPAKGAEAQAGAQQPTHSQAPLPNRAAAHLSAEQQPQLPSARATGGTALRPGADSGRRTGTPEPQGQGQPQMPPFRMESQAGGLQQREPFAPAAAALEQAGTGHADIGPADVIIGAGPTDSIAVTIAAATPDLRDRFRSVAGDLHAELTSLGTEVDSIRVALRAGMSADDPGSGQTGREERGLRDPGLSETGQTGMGTQDWSRPDLPLDGSATAGTDADGDEAGTTLDADAQTAGNEGRSRDPEGGYQRPDERFRFSVALQGSNRAGAIPSGSAESAALPGKVMTTQAGSPDAFSRNRIDRYA